MTGCITHNHVDNPTMKRMSWMTRRRIAKHLLLGRSKTEIVRDIMPRHHVEGQRKVTRQEVERVFHSINGPKPHRLTEGLDAMSLVAKDGCLGGVYPWPPPNEGEKPVKKETRTKVAIQ